MPGLEDVRGFIKKRIEELYVSGIKKHNDIYKKVFRETLFTYPQYRQLRDEVAETVREELNNFILIQKRASWLIGRRFPTKDAVKERKKVLEEIKKIELSGGRRSGESASDYADRFARDSLRKEEYEDYRRFVARTRKEGRITGSTYRETMESLDRDYQDLRPARPLKELAKKEKKLRKDQEKYERETPLWERNSSEFNKKALHEREAERERWYKEEAKKLDERIKDLKWRRDNQRITPEQFEMEMADIRDQRAELRRRAYGDIGFKRSMRFFGRGLKHIGKASESKYGAHLMKVAQVLALSIIGVIVTASFNSLWFFFAFLSLALYFIVPSPHDYEARENQKIGSKDWVKSFSPFSKQYSGHNGAAFIKSLAKASAIICFALAFKDLSDVFNIIYIGIFIFGYFSLKVTYDTSADFIESLFRFGIGMFFIPSMFVSIFDSWVLGAIALAFFAVPPLPSSKDVGKVMSEGLSGASAIYQMVDKAIFVGLMLFALIGSGSVPGLDLGATWQLSGTLQNTFLYFWIVCGIAGFFSPASERPVTGAIMIGAATIIYGIGPGSQMVGSGLLGDWWPTVHNTFTSFTEPLSNVMSSLGSTFSQGFLLLTNPVAYATQLMNGTYASNPVGQTGAYGVDITSMTITSILPEQPFVITSIIENKGAFDAKNVEVSLGLLTGDKYATTGKARTDFWPSILKQNQFKIVNLGFTTQDCTYKAQSGASGTATGDLQKCYKYYSGNPVNTLSRGLVWQASFQSSGIPCSTITGFDLRKKYLPIGATVSYDYQSDSRVSVEFISQAEWDRLSQTGDLDSQFRLIESQYSSAPVKFPIGTAGLKNPILENQEFHISMSLTSAFTSNSEITKVSKVNLTYPADWKLKSCSPTGYKDPVKSKDGTSYTVQWTDLGAGAKTFACYFEPLNTNAPLGGTPTKTYVVTANADYGFSRWKVVDTQIQFGGFCCPDTSDGSNGASKDCLDTQTCVNHACVSTSIANGGTSTTTDYSSIADYSVKRATVSTIPKQLHLGMGNCNSDSDCLQSGASVMTPSYWSDPTKAVGVKKEMKCVNVYSGVNACCYVTATVDQCRKAFDNWFAQTKTSPALLQPNYPYPDEVSIHNAAGL